MNLYGWAGKILKIDLTEHKIETINTADYSDRFLGGLGLGQKLYWDNANPGASAFAPENPLIMMTGPLTGTTAPSAPRLAVCGKSPCIYPETFVNASIAGFFPAEIKKAGFDGIFVTGKSDKPVYINIQDEKAAIKDAGHLWGLTNSKTMDTIKAEVGNKARIISIGPGAETPTRIGIMFTDVAGSASMGFGSVMGSKNLKAIAVQGTNTVPVADPEEIKIIRKKIRAMRGDGFFNLYGNPIVLPGTEVVKKAHCHGCPQGCWRSLQKGPNGELGIRKCQTGVFYSLWDKKLHGKPTEASFRATTLLNEYSLCGMETVFLLMWLDKCLESNTLTEKDVELPVSKLGSIEFLEAMIEKICKREGFGAVLAEGSLRASEIVGGKGREFTRNFLTPSGRAIAYGPKVFIHSALIYATEPRPFITELHEVCEPFTKWALWYTSKGEKSYVSTDVLRGISEKFWGSRDAVDFSTYNGKALASFLIQNRQYVKESLTLCDFTFPVYDDASTPDHVGDPELENRLLSAVTGKEVTKDELNRIGERIFALNRAILLREGRNGKKDDILPEFFFVEQNDFVADVFGMHNPQLLLPASGDEVVSRKGKAVERQKFENIRDEYYELRGWDLKTGLMKRMTLEQLNLSDVVDSLGEQAV